MSSFSNWLGAVVVLPFLLSACGTDAMSIGGDGAVEGTGGSGAKPSQGTGAVSGAGKEQPTNPGTGGRGSAGASTAGTGSAGKGPGGAGGKGGAGTAGVGSAGAAAAGSSGSMRSCVISGCSSEICGGEPMAGICLWNPEYACYRTAACERQKDGLCSWTPTPELAACLAAARGEEVPKVDPCKGKSCGDACSTCDATQGACPAVEEYCNLDGACTMSLPECKVEPPPEPCLISGCSGEICADENMVSDCVMKPEYACYAKASCERQSDGVCGWTPTDELKSCLAGTTPSNPCAGKACGDSCSTCDSSNGPCPAVVEYCNAQGSCSPSITACPKPSTCIKTGCSGQICAAENIGSTCEWREEYACYRDATCEIQSDGACGWSPTDQLKVCLSAAQQ